MPPVKEEASNAEVLAKLTAVVEMLAAQNSGANMAQINETIASTLSALSKQSAEANARAVMPSNAMNLDGRSVYRPKGHLHPDYLPGGADEAVWHRQPWYNGHRVTLDEVTPDEIKAYNELSRLLGSASSQRTARDGKYRVWISANNAEMYLSVPCRSVEDQMNEPATLVFVLREFIDGKAIDPASLYHEVASLKAQLEQMAKQATA